MGENLPSRKRPCL